MEPYLPVIWAGVIVVAVAMYVILDGFDLGIALLFPTTSDEAERDQMMNSVAPFWDGNETWLVLGGGGLWVAFPLAYSIIMPAFYLPVIAMLLGLVFRGVAFEFRWVAKPSHLPWDIAFFAGSLVAAFCQGVILGGLVEGVAVANGAFAGGPFDWASPFALMCGCAVTTGYALLGATFLVMKTEGRIADHARQIAKRLIIAVLVFMAAVSLWTALSSERIAERWFSLPNLVWLAPVPLVTALVGFGVWRSLERGGEMAPFAGTIALFLLGLLGLAISSYPFIVPPSVTLYDAAAVPASQMFSLIGAMITLPMVLAYTVFVYWTFRGKMRPGQGYH
ncbi:cytochrome d ubiquinol oxidase subunit II [Blastochloris viridis]|uniref:Cytochrome d ubiquinol oxidase subunit 2 n=1 Tax=Blastochloris viridis TaxID=1079 RepID=A0A0H5BBV8_BLAVI|nr:cytochrome d ubiquinol oxidase subunit II [Blastochloris viridis]ALK10380.1 Cytochrome bd-I ubiquinol oxidase subunit 2 [Blastochloris viridis]BAR99680.1 putative Cytochrome bd2 [Blastochloris viridis]CUU43042.1 Cytochrome d ubiquinol oxidase subunit 2 [Blastochloris viridis]